LASIAAPVLANSSILSILFAFFLVFAPKRCKPEQATEKRVVSLRKHALFHKLINTYVENFIVQKYLARKFGMNVATGTFSAAFPFSNGQW
jgi:hypothetical protein